MAGRMQPHCENKHVKQTSRVWGSGFTVVTTASRGQRANVIGARTKYCKGMVGENTHMQMTQVKTRISFFASFLPICNVVQKKTQMMISGHMQLDTQA